MLHELALKVHPHILQYDRIFKYESEASVKYLQALSENEIEKYQRKTLIKRFGGRVEVNIRETQMEPLA